MKAFSIAIIGATGLVGSKLIEILAERCFPVSEYHLIASRNSSGCHVTIGDTTHEVIDLEQFDFSQSDVAFFCVSSDLAARYVPIATAAGNLVIDKSYHFRYDPAVPLIVPEVNPHHLSTYKTKHIIANPNCSTIPIAVSLKPIYDAVGIQRINIATYQSVSGTGKEGIAELDQQTKQYLQKQPVTMKAYSQQIAFNVLPHCDDFQNNGYTREEMKIVWELRKIFNDEKLAINPTAVRVPVYYGHAASIHIETIDKITQLQAEQLLNQAHGVKLIKGDHPYPTPVSNAAGTDEVFVGRLREDISHPRGLNCWVVTDNIRKGAALNAVQIVEHLIQNHMI